MDFKGCDEKMRDFAPETIIHLAAHHFIPYCEEHQCEAYALNVQGTLHMLEEIRMATRRRAVLPGLSRVMFIHQSMCHIVSSIQSVPSMSMGLASCSQSNCVSGTLNQKNVLRTALMSDTTAVRAKPTLTCWPK